MKKRIKEWNETNIMDDYNDDDNDKVLEWGVVEEGEGEEQKGKKEMVGGWESGERRGRRTYQSEKNEWFMWFWIVGKGGETKGRRDKRRENSKERKGRKKDEEKNGHYNEKTRIKENEIV